MRGLVFEQKWLLWSECPYVIYGHVPILGGVEGPFLTVFVTLGSGDLDAINIFTQGSPVIIIVIVLSNGVYGHMPILGGVEGPFLTALGYYW